MNRLLLVNYLNFINFQTPPPPPHKHTHRKKHNQGVTVFIPHHLNPLSRVLVTIGSYKKNPCFRAFSGYIPETTAPKYPFSRENYRHTHAAPLYMLYACYAFEWGPGFRHLTFITVHDGINYILHMTWSAHALRAGISPFRGHIQYHA